MTKEAEPVMEPDPEFLEEAAEGEEDKGSGAEESGNEEDLFAEEVEETFD